MSKELKHSTFFVYHQAEEMYSLSIWAKYDNGEMVSITTWLNAESLQMLKQAISLAEREENGVTR